MQVTVTSINSSDTTHILSLSATMPDNLPGGHYAIQATVAPIGHSNSVNITAPYEITGISPTSGSMAGGQLVTISGTGFSTDIAAVRAIIAGVPCAVESATPTAIECRTGPVEAAPGDYSIILATPAVLQVQPSAFAPLVAVQGVMYSYVEGPTVDSITPTRGSTAGGTPVAITGSGFTDDIVSVAMGDTMCVEVDFVSSSVIRCLDL
jgi:hypothetical protein